MVYELEVWIKVIFNSGFQCFHTCSPAPACGLVVEARCVIQPYKMASSRELLPLGKPLVCRWLNTCVCVIIFHDVHTVTKLPQDSFSQHLFPWLSNTFPCDEVKQSLSKGPRSLKGRVSRPTEVSNNYSDPRMEKNRNISGQDLVIACFCLTA